MKKVGMGLILVSLAGCGSDKSPLKFSTPQKVINTLEVENKKDHILKNFDDIVYRMTTAFEDNLKKPMPPKGRGEPVSPLLIEELKYWKNLQD